MKSITQIVPRLPPAIDGLGDYAVKLGQQLNRDFGIQTRFIVGEPKLRGASTLEDFPVSQVRKRSSAALLSCLGEDSSVVLLHYVGYGYNKRGCPLWLVDGLERWQRGSSHRVLITMFHEIYAFGPVWTSSFWLSPTQRRLAARLSLISSQSITNREGYAESLRRLSRGKCWSVRVLPVFSNIGEPAQMPPPLTKRRRRLVVFGSRGHRHLVFQKSLMALERTCRALGIEEVFDVGALAEHGVIEIDGIPVSRTGVLGAHKVSALLSSALVGFFNYPTDYLGKSTIFASYCAHRVLPVSVHSSSQSADGLHRDQHFWLADRRAGEWSMAAAQLVADNAYDWYQGHNLSRQAKAFMACIAASAPNGAPADVLKFKYSLF